jgi:RND family efflux transporter MFP subunit
MGILKVLLRYTLPVFVVLFGIGGCFFLFQSRPESAQKPPKPPAALVETAKAIKQPVTFRVQSQGSVSPRTQTTLIPEVSGEIVEVSPQFISGGFFSKGDVLVKIDPSNYETALKRANAAVKRAETQVATENALAGYAAQDWQRLRSLNATNTPASDLTLRKPQLAEALAGLESAEADREKAMRDLTRTIIRAPYDGMVREKRADIGQFVTSGTQLAQTFATDFAEVRLPLTQNDLRYLEIPRTISDEPLDVILRAEIGGQNIEWAAQVVRSEGVFDETRRVLYVVAQVNDPYSNESENREPLRVGTFVTAEVKGLDAGKLFVIPRSSLSRGTTLWVVDEQSKIYPQTLNIVRSDRQFAYVSDGIEEGMTYCLTPPNQPLPGMMVRMDG